MGKRHIIKFSKDEHKVVWDRCVARLSGRRERRVTNDDLLAEFFKRCPDLSAQASVRRA